MKKYLVPIFFLYTTINAFGQVNDCPALPKKDSWDTLAYIKTEIPTDATKAKGIWLGQGTTNGKPGFIPTNHPGWAIGIAHAWNYSRNMNQRVEYPKIGYWMATLIQESELVCAAGSTWGTVAQEPVAYQTSMATGNAQSASIMSNGGCYQIEGPGSAWGALMQAYPFGRFTAANYAPLNESLIAGDVQPMLKAYYDLNTMYVFNYYMGWPMYKNIDCNLSTDAYSYEKMTASAYNGGPNGFLNAYSILTGPNACWSGLPATTAGYAESVASRMAVVENNTSYCGGWPASSSFGGYYNANIAWTDVTSYLTNIALFYPEINFTTQVTPKVQAAFIGVSGSTATAIPFKQLGPVIDAIILALPLERPNQVEGSPVGISLAACKGNQLPFGHVDILDGSTTMCLGNSVTLSLTVEDGGGSTPSFKWYKNSVTTANLIGTNQTITITPTATGTFVYCAQICNSNGCYTVYSNSANTCNDSRDINGFHITVNNCSSCSFTASATSVNTPCKGMNNGQINLTLTNAPASYTVSYNGSTPLGAVSGSFNSSGSTVSIPNLRDGSYNIIVQDLSNPSCKAYTNVIVNYTTLINEYIDAVKTQASGSCSASVVATLKELPASCNWKIRVYNDVYFQWENWVNAGVVTSTGISTLEKSTRTAPKPEIDQWNDVPVSEQLLTLNTGDKISFYTALTPTPGATQQRAYTYQIFDQNNTLVYSVISPVGAANSGVYKVGPDYTVTCPTPALPAYTYSWSPALNTTTNTATTSSGTINVNFTVPTTYTITATNPTNTQCKITDTIIVEPTCPTALPLNTITFSASLTNQVVVLNWTTMNEINCKSYSILRSRDGINFESIGSVNCNNKISLSDYEYTDVAPLGGISYYRLQEVDFNGDVSYTEIRQVGTDKWYVSVMPNPFTNQTELVVSGLGTQKVTVRVIDMSGKELYQLNNINADRKIALGEDLALGVYLLQVINSTEVLNYKIVKE